MSAGPDVSSGDFSWLTSRKAVLLLAAAGALLFLLGGGGADPEYGDACRVAGIIRETYEEGSYLLPRLNGRPFLEYPPLYYWCGAAGFAACGVNDYALHLPSLLAGVLGMLGCFGLARSLRFSTAAAFGTALMLGTSAQFFRNALTCRVDALLALWVLLAWWGFALLAVAEARRPKTGFLLLTLGLAGCTLTKNLAGAVIPLSGIGAWLISSDLAERRFRPGRYLVAGLALAAALLPYGCYLYFLYRQYGAAAAQAMGIANNFGRFSGDFGGHAEPWYYYLKRLPEQFQPYLVLLAGGLFVAAKRLKSHFNARDSYLAVLLLVPFVLLCISGGKRQVYLLPLAIPAALLAGSFLEWATPYCRRVPERLQPETVSRWLLRIAGTAALAVAVVGISLSPGAWRACLGVVVAAAACFFSWRATGPRRWTALVVSVLAIYLVIGGSLLPRKYAKDSPRRLFACFRDRRVLLHQPIERLSGAAYYYRGCRTPELTALDCRFQTGDVVILEQDQLSRLPGREWRLTQWPGDLVAAEKISGPGI